MLELLSGVTGKVTVNGAEYNSVQDAISVLTAANYSGPVTVTFGAQERAAASVQQRTAPTASAPQETADTLYKIKVRQYMTKPASSGFEFHTKWNNNVPMPLRVMVGKKLQETRGMVKMELWGQITDEITMTCMKCGRTLTNPVSRYFGIGPECGGHNYTHPFDTEEELRAAVKAQNEQLQNIRWTGWIIKSAIEEQEVIK